MVYLQLQATGSGFVSVTYTAFLLQESKPTLFSGYSQTSATFDSHLAFVFFLTHIFAFQLCPSPRLKWNLFISLVVSKKGSHISGIFESNLSKNVDIQYDNFWISARWPPPTGTYCGPPQSQTSDVWLTVDLESVSWGLGRPFMHTSKILLNLILSESPNKIYIDVMSDNTVLTFLYFFFIKQHKSTKSKLTSNPAHILTKERKNDNKKGQILALQCYLWLSDGFQKHEHQQHETMSVNSVEMLESRAKKEAVWSVNSKLYS